LDFVAWDQAFFDPITVPGRKLLVTLRDAALYITKLPKAEHDAEPWQAAMEALLLVAEHGGPTMLARIGVMAFKDLLESLRCANADSGGYSASSLLSPTVASAPNGSPPSKSASSARRMDNAKKRID